jgi:SAM-dependent methyltransferase
MSVENYIGNELELFDKAKNWKNYYGNKIKPLLKGDVLEVGAGIGATTKSLCNGDQNKWVCLEPDAALAKQVQLLLQQKDLPPCCELRIGTLEQQSNDELFDAIIYIDVIEHIENDAAELQRAKNHLKKGGNLIILVPAHQWLYSPFDEAIGHFRRYNKQMLKKAIPQDLKQQKLVYLDSVGLMASVANKLFLKQSYPTQKQVLFWDTILVPISRITDVISFNATGKSLLGIWQKT